MGGDPQFEDLEKMTAEVKWEKAEAAALEAESMENEEASQEGIDESMEEDSAPVSDKTDAPSTEEKSGDDEEDPSNLEQAWEMLELAKIIYTKQMEAAAEDKKIELGRRICEIFLHLGEVSLENEN